MSNKNDLIKLIQKALDAKIKLEGAAEKGQGYMGDVFFFKTIKNEPNQDSIELDLVAKVSKNEQSRRDIISEVFIRETTFYEQIVPLFTEFQQDSNIKKSFCALPKYYKTIVSDNSQILILENLKSRGYQLHLPHKPLSINHIKLVLKNYSKFHAISFALNDLRKDKFDKIVDLYRSSKFVEQLDIFKEFYEKATAKCIRHLNEAGRQDLVQKFKKLEEKGILNIVKDVYKDVPEEKVVIHGDCHNNNFLFKYKDENNEVPSDVVFIDFQFSTLQSPMQDLGYFFYMVTSRDELFHFKELMEFYYNELSCVLSEFGSDINKIYPISSMWKHWKKYSFFGFTQACLLLDLFFAEEAPDTANLTENIDDFFPNINTSNRKAYLDRLVAVVDHYFNFEIN